MTDGASEHRPDGLVFVGTRFNVRLETRPLPSGGAHQFEIVESPDAAAIVPILAGDEEPLVVLVEQERPAVGGRLLEIPAGLLEAQERPEETAVRELREETGYTAGSLRALTRIYSSPGVITEAIHIYLATDLTLMRASPTPADTDEIARVRSLPLREAVSMALRGEILDAKTIVGLLLARDAFLGATGQRDQMPANEGGAGVQMDPLNPPYSTEGGASDEAPTGDSGLRFETILGQEYNYANVTAYQAMEDRARLFSLYLTLVGVLATALGVAYQFGIANDSKTRQYFPLIALLLVFLVGALGVVFFLQLIRLRQAWRQSALVMNRIKEYYIRHFIKQVPDAVDAFHWRTTTIPTGERFGSVTFLICFTVAVLGSLAFGATFLIGAAYLQTQMGLSSTDGLSLAVLAGLAVVVAALSLLLHTLYFRSQLSKKREIKAVEEEERIIGPTAKLRPSQDPWPRSTERA
jgi:ADP-ribose pyrophosphatase